VVDIKNLIGDLFALLSSKYPQLLMSESMSYAHSFTGPTSYKPDSKKQKSSENETKAHKLAENDEGEPRTGDPYSLDFMNIVKMVKEGKTPPNVREIDDSPLEPASKPLEKSLAGGNNKPWQTGIN